MQYKALVIGLLAAVSVGPAVADEAKEQAAVAKQLSSAKITLQQGLTASESKGKPISGKFEVDEGHFQLSIYISQGTALQEVVVDHTTGSVAKSEPLSEAEDVAEAKKQAAAMAKATVSLKAAVDKAEQGSPGYRAVSIEPMLKANHALGEVSLVKGTQFKSVSVPLE